MNGMPTPTGVICVALMLTPAMPALGQNLTELLQPPLVVGSDTTPLTTDFFSGRLNVQSVEICDAARQVLADLGDEALTEGDCAISTERLFIMGRSEADRLTSWRIKLNAPSDDEATGLALLLRVSEGIHARIGWTVPALVKAAILGGEDISCSSGALNYRFSRERNDSGSFNLTMAINGGRRLETQQFQRLVLACR